MTIEAETHDKGIDANKVELTVSSAIRTVAEFARGSHVPISDDMTAFVSIRNHGMHIPIYPYVNFDPNLEHFFTKQTALKEEDGIDTGFDVQEKPKAYTLSDAEGHIFVITRVVNGVQITYDLAGLFVVAGGNNETQTANVSDFIKKLTNHLLQPNIDNRAFSRRTKMANRRSPKLPDWDALNRLAQEQPDHPLVRKWNMYRIRKPVIKGHKP